MSPPTQRKARRILLRCDKKEKAKKKKLYFLIINSNVPSVILAKAGIQNSPQTPLFKNKRGAFMR